MQMHIVKDNRVRNASLSENMSIQKMFDRMNNAEKNWKEFCDKKEGIESIRMPCVMVLLGE